MGTIDLLRPGQRAVGFERSSSEVLALAQAFNEMLERLEDERRESSARVLAAQEAGAAADRARAARRDRPDAHGGRAARRARRAAAAAAEHPEFAELAEIVQRSLDDVRRISLELRPGALDELGLVNALISLCARVSDQSGIRVHRALEAPAPELSPEVELAIYRIAQEALTNVMRHSRRLGGDVSRSDVRTAISSSRSPTTAAASLIEVAEGGGLTGHAGASDADRSRAGDQLGGRRRRRA